MYSSDRRNGSTLEARVAGVACLALAMVGFIAVPEVYAQVTSVSPVVFSSATLVGKSNSTGASATPNGSASIGRISANQRGDIFGIFTDTSGKGYNSLVEIPAGTSTQITIAKSLTNTTTAVTVDPHGNLWFQTQAPNGYDSAVDVVPFVNGTYATGIDLSTTTLPPCVLPANTTTAPCQFPPGDTDPWGFLLISDLQVDSAGDLYVASWADCYVAGCTYDAEVNIFEYNATTGAVTAVVPDIAINGLSYGGDTDARFAVAANGDIYYVDSVNFFYSKAGSGTYSAISGFVTPSGVTIDSGGNVYVTDSGNNRIVVLPNINGVVSTASAYTLLSGAVLGATPYYSVGIDGYGNISYAGTSSANVIYKASAGGLNLGSVAIGSTSAATDLDLYFTAPETFGSVKFISGAGTSPFAIGTDGCTVGKSYTVGKTCSLTITYKPSAPGPQSGTLGVYSQTGILLGTAWLAGSGTGPLLHIDPGTVSAIGSGWKAPSAIATDGGGNTYVADSSTGDIYKNGSATAIATGFNAPSAIVVDGAGNLYVGDSGNSRIVEVPYSGTAYGTPIVVETGLLGPSALAIDSAGNLYVADSGNARVLLLASSAGLAVGSDPSSVGTSLSATGKVITGFTKPVGIAADSLGNVYVADSGTIFQVGIKSGVTTKIAQALTTAAAVAVDPGGNLYYADSGAKTITFVPNVGGSVTGSGSTILSTVVVATPDGLAFDSSGNLYAVDTTDATVGKLSRTASTLSFGNVVGNVSSSPLTATLSNGGTSAATLSSPFETQMGSTDFSIQSSSTCKSGGSIPTGGSCSVVEVFKPTVFAAETASLTFASNAGAPTLALSGTGVVLVNATYTGPASIVYGAPGTFTVSVAPNIVPSYQVNFTSSQGALVTTTVAIGSNGTGTFTTPATLPAGSYTIALVGTVGSATLNVTTATLVADVSNATRAYGANNPAFSCTFTSGIVNNDVVACNASVANTVTPTSPVGTYPITPSSAGTAAVNYTIAPPPTSTYGTLTITLATPNVTVGDTPASVSAINTILVGTSVAITSTVTSLTKGTPTGTVTFEDVTLANAVKVLGTATLVNGSASISTSSLASGTIYVEAIYSGDADFAGTDSIPLGITISTPSFQMAINPQTLVIKQGQFGTAQLTITPVGNYTAPIVLSCSGLPLETTCAFSPGTVKPSNQNTQTVDLVVTTTSTSSSARMRRSAPWGSTGAGTTLALLAGLFAGWRRKRFIRGLLTGLLLAMIALLPMTGCGTGLNEPNFYTPLGTYPSVTITGSSNSTGVVVPVTLRLSVTNP